MLLNINVNTSPSHVIRNPLIQRAQLRQQCESETDDKREHHSQQQPANKEADYSQQPQCH